MGRRTELIARPIPLMARQYWPPQVINTDQNPAYGEALRQLKRDDSDAKSIEHRQAHVHDSESGKLRLLTRDTTER